MKRKYLSVCVVILICITITGCGEINQKTYDEKVDRFYSLFDEVNEYLYPFVVECLGSGQIPNNSFYEDYESQLTEIDNISKELNDSKFKEDVDNGNLKELTNRRELLYLITTDCISKEFANNQTSKWQLYRNEVKDRYKELNINPKDIIYDKNPLQKYMDENNVRLTNKDVQYNMGNNLNEKFIISGYAELDDYYNYGFRDCETKYFCVNITPDDGGYTDSWYIYLDRDSFEDLFDKLKKGNKHIIAICEIPSNMYEDNQQLMARVRRVYW